jgi:hypothetical protein
VVSLHLCERVTEPIFGRISITSAITHLVTNVPSRDKEYSIFTEMVEVMEDTDISICVSACGSQVPELKKVSEFTVGRHPTPLDVCKVEVQFVLSFSSAGWYMISVHHGAEMIASRAVQVIDANFATGRLPSKGLNVITTRDQQPDPRDHSHVPEFRRGEGGVEEGHR